MQLEFHVASLVELPVERGESRESEEGIVRLRGQLRAPVPCRGEPAVDARACIEEVISARTVEPVSEEVSENVLLRLLDASMGRDVSPQPFVLLARSLDVDECAHEWRQDPRHLRVLVYEDESVGDVVVSQVNDGAAHPRVQLALGHREDLMHGLVYARGLLHALEPLTRVAQLVLLRLAQQVPLGEIPQPEHVFEDR